MGTRRTPFGGSFFSLGIVALMVDGPLERLLGLMGSAFGSISEKNGGVLLDSCTLKWEIVQRPSFGLIFGVGLEVSRLLTLNSIV